MAKEDEVLEGLENEEDLLDFDLDDISPEDLEEEDSEEEIIDLVDIWRELEYSSEVWVLIIDRKPKEVTIQEYIKLYRERGVNINKPAAHYVMFIDELLRDRKELLNSPFKDVLRFAAVVEYDFDNGQNRDEMALVCLRHLYHQKPEAF